MGSPAPDFVISPIILPPSVGAKLCALAASTDVLILGEMHGTREVPRLVLGLLDQLKRFGYTILALEIPQSQETHLHPDD